MKRKLALVFAILMMLSLLVGCGSQTVAQSNAQPESNDAPKADAAPKETKNESTTGAPIVIKYGGGASETSYFGQTARYLEKLVNEELAGEVEFQVYLGEQLGSNTAMLENLQVDLQQAWGGSLDLLAEFAPDLNITTMAFAFDNMDHVNAFLASEIGDQIFQKIEDNNIKVLNYNCDRLPRAFISKTPITTLSDMKGLKWRVPNIEIYEKNFSALGAVPTIVAWSEYPYALMQGTVDAGECSEENIVPDGFHLVAPYISLVEYAYAKDCLVINMQTWNKLNPEQQSKLQECVDKAAEFYVNLNIEAWEKDQKTIVEEGGTFVEFDRQSFIDGVSNLADELESEHFWETENLYEYVKNLSY